MRKILLLFVMCITWSVQAQFLEIGLHGGVSNYQGDLTPSELWNSIGESHTSVGVFSRYNINNFFSARLMLTKATISGTDREADDPSRRRRNLHFVSPIYEAALLGEINLLGYKPSNLYTAITPYVFGGGAIFHFNPQTEYQERWIDLQPLGTEGQGLPGYDEKYKLTQFSIVGGGGIKINVNEEWTIGIELAGRKTFTDHLDDVGNFYVNYYELLEGNGSDAAALADRTGEFLGTEPVILESGTRIRGNSGSLDWYFTGQVTISYNFVFKGIYSSSVNSRHLGCPKKF